MATIAPQISERRPSWVRIGIALAIALASDGFSFVFSATVIAEPLVISVDLVTAFAIWIALGQPAILLIALVAEAIPVVGMFPLWTVVVGIIAATGKLPGRGTGTTVASTKRTAPPPTLPPAP